MLSLPLKGQRSWKIHWLINFLVLPVVQRVDIQVEVKGMEGEKKGVLSLDQWRKLKVIF